MNYTKTMFKQSLKEKKIFNFYVFYGEENFLIKTSVKDVAKLCGLVEKGENFSPFNFRSCFYEDFNLEEFENFSKTFPFLVEKKVFVLNCGDFSKFTLKNFNAIKTVLESACCNLILIFTANGNSYNIKKTAIFKKLVNLKTSCCVEFNFESLTLLYRAFSKKLKSFGISISYENFLILTKRCGRSIDFLNLELEKISAFVGKGEIKKQDILNLTSAQIENNAFKIAQNILIGEKEKAIKIFNEISFSGVNILQIFSAIGFCFVDLYRAKLAKIKNFKLNEILKFYNYSGKEFRIKNALLNCNAYSIEKLRFYVSLMADLDFKLKNKSMPKNVLVEKFLFAL